jgi:hypothetical protein
LELSTTAATIDVANVVGAGFIAVVASLVARSIFFCLQESWKRSRWKWGLCGALLAGAASGMYLINLGDNSNLENAGITRGNQHLQIALAINFGI